MPLPRGDEYLAAVQNPRTAFADSDLKATTAEADHFGMPKPYSGGFTTTFHMLNHQQHWAARCFTRNIPDIQARYAALGRFIQQHPEPFLVHATCLPNGIRVGQAWHPIIKMQWVKGETLNNFAERNLNTPAAIAGVIPAFLSLVRRLEELGIAHGDLQHGNIVISQGKVTLIDYDGFFIPDLARLKTNEMGHVNFQHPKRTGQHYNASVDRFASFVIYLGLLAISKQPSLWNKYDNSENLLFKADDFENPDSSPLLADLERIPDLGKLVERFRGACRLDFDRLPTLETFIAGNFTYPAAPARPVAVGAFSPRSQYLVLDGSRSGALLEHIGERVVVIGRITDSTSRRTKRGTPYVFLNVGRYPGHTFTAVLWDDGLAAFNRAGVNPRAFLNRWIRATGVLSSYRGHVQMVLETPAQITIIPSDEEARKWLGIDAQAATRPTVRQPGPAPVDESVFNTLYRGRPTVRPSTPPPVVSQPQPAPQPAKKQESTLAGAGAVVSGLIGLAVGGPVGLIIGGIIGYNVGKKIK